MRVPLEGEKMRTQSSSQPERINFPFLGKQIERQVVLGTEIFMIGVISSILHTTIYEPEQVPKMSSKSLMKARPLILVEWQV